MLFSYLYETEEDLVKPPHFYSDVVGSDSLRLLKNCVGTLSKPLCRTPPTYSLTSIFIYFKVSKGGVIILLHIIPS